MVQNVPCVHICFVFFLVKDYCKDWSTCSQTCMSSREGFTCVCSENYKLSADGKVCKALGDPPVQLYVKGDIIMRLVTHPMYFVDAETMENVSLYSNFCGTELF